MGYISVSSGTSSLKDHFHFELQYSDGLNSYGEGHYILLVQMYKNISVIELEGLFLETAA